MPPRCPLDTAAPSSNTSPPGGLLAQVLGPAARGPELKANGVPDFRQGGWKAISKGVTFKLKAWQELGVERVRGTALLAQGMARTEALRQRELGVFKEPNGGPRAWSQAHEAGLEREAGV